MEQQEQRLRRGDEHIARFAEEPDALACGSIAGSNSDLRDDTGMPCEPAAAAMPASGTRRLRSMSTASALSGETAPLDIVCPEKARARTSAGSGTTEMQPGSYRFRSAPESASIRRAIAGHPSRCGLVGAGNAVENHARTAG